MGPLYISGKHKVRNYKFDRRVYKPKNAKVGQKGSGVRHVTYFYKYGTPVYISGKGTVRNFKFGVRIDLQACKPKNAKVRQKGRGLRHVTYFLNFGTPFISPVSYTHLTLPTNREV